jgi:hypothetical protein
LLWSSILAALVVLALPFSLPGQRWFDLVPLPPMLLGFILLVLLSYFLAAEALKRRVLSSLAD